MKFFDLEMDTGISGGGRDVRYKIVGPWTECNYFLYTHGNSYDTCSTNAYTNVFSPKCWRHKEPLDDALDSLK